MGPCRTYRDHKFKPSRVRLDDAAYEQAMRTFVVLCADVVLCAPQQRLIYLADRVVHPVKGWWWMGGRISFGEDFKDAAVRKLSEETLISIDPERLTFVMQHRTISHLREQSPQEAGSDTLGFLFRVDVTQDELNVALNGLAPEEYQPRSLTPFNRRTLTQQNVRPQIMDAYDRIYSR
jgi:8-oxo-dGTP pyrophosphatase MutT (NUDIX family)